MKKYILPALAAAMMAAPAMLRADNVRWGIVDTEMTPVEGRPGCYEATLPQLPDGASIDFTDGPNSRTTAAYTHDGTSEFTVDASGRVVPYTTGGITTDITIAPAPDASGTARYYTPAGIPVENPSQGLFIKVVNGKATKVFLNK